MKTALILALSVAAIGVSSAPAAAQEGRHHGWNRRAMVCTQWRHHMCVRRGHAYGYNRVRGGDYRVGYRFAPNYAYTPYNQLPSPYVSQYNLAPDGRYVYTNNRIYVVNRRTNAVERILDAISR